MCNSENEQDWTTELFIKNPFLKEKWRKHLPQKKKYISLSLSSLTHNFIYIKVTILFKILHFSTMGSFTKFLLEV